MCELVSPQSRLGSMGFFCSACRKSMLKNQQHSLSFSLFGKSASFIVIDSLKTFVLSIVDANLFLLSNMRSMTMSKAGLAATGSTAFVSIYPIPSQSAFVLASQLLTSLSLFLSFLLPTRMSSALSSPFSLSSSTQYCMLRKDARSVISKISITPSTLRQKIGVMVLYRSVPAVSHSCTFINFPSGSSMIFCLYSTPMVGVTRSTGSPMYRLKRLVFPTALSPSRRILQRSPSFICRQYQLHPVLNAD